jgi:hypothetical protein
VEFCKVPPGEDHMADAYNLMVCAWVAHKHPKMEREAKKMAEAICRSVNDWEPVSAGLAFFAAEFGNFADKALPEEFNGKKYERPTERYRLEIEKRNLVQA